jgi:hypothetical protein
VLSLTRAFCVNSWRRAEEGCQVSAQRLTADGSIHCAHRALKWSLPIDAIDGLSIREPMVEAVDGDLFRRKQPALTQVLPG